MPDREAHLLQADRNERFLARIYTPDQPYLEWVVTVWFYICLHYVDAMLAAKGHLQIAGHSDRWTKLPRYDETRAVADDFHQLYKEGKEARYQCSPYTPADLREIETRYLKIRNHLRTALGLP